MNVISVLNITKTLPDNNDKNLYSDDEFDSYKKPPVKFQSFQKTYKFNTFSDGKCMNIYIPNLDELGDNELDNIGFTRIAAPPQSQNLRDLTQSIRYTGSSRIMYEEEKVEGDLYDRRLSLESRQNGNARSAEEDHFSTPSKDTHNIFGQYTTDEEETV